MTTTTYQVTGLTCGHCVKAVTEEVGELHGVSSVNVDLVKGGASTLTITSESPLERDAVQAALHEAGDTYDLQGE
ncbi:heavy-metal-associated domain-containing protein [Devriesea agamarum]|uniref:heavy-metal-associated domain-containing protein n=1 Tax=Devriesea agamarum TaxID=472569 RepID=UPI00071D7FF6|nr:cation transporter [Devriesea agamarum]